MINTDLDRRLADCQELVEAWRAFLNLINRAVKSGENVSPQMEQQFLNAKARIAMLHDSFMESLRHDKNVGANMLEIVNRAITLRTLKKVSESEARKVEIEWHEVFLLLNETVSNLNEERNELAEVNEFTFRIKKAQQFFLVRIKAFLSSIYFKVVLGIAIFIFVLWGVPAFGIYNYDELRNIPRLRPVVTGYLNLTRTWVGLQSPYYDMERFMHRPLNDRISGFQDPPHTLETSSVSKVEAINNIVRAYNNQKLQDLLERAEAYEVVAYTPSSISGAVGRVRGYYFWFRQTRDAREAEYELNASTRPEKFTHGRKVNVIWLGQSNSQSSMSDFTRNLIANIEPR